MILINLIVAIRHSSCVNIFLQHMTLWALWFSHHTCTVNVDDMHFTVASVLWLWNIMCWWLAVCKDIAVCQQLTTYCVGLAHCSFPKCKYVFIYSMRYYSYANPFISYHSPSSCWCHCWRRGWRNNTDLSDNCWSYYSCCCLLTKTGIHYQRDYNRDNTVMLCACSPSCISLVDFMF